MQDFAASTDLMARVFTYLTPAEVAQAGQTCKSWHEASLDPALWRKQAVDIFGAELAVQPQQDARTTFAGRWVASRAKLALLRVPQSRSQTPASALTLSVAPLARPHRLALAHYILGRLEAALMLRLDWLSLTAGIARAAVCAHPKDAAEVAYLGAALGLRYMCRV